LKYFDGAKITKVIRPNMAIIIIFDLIFKEPLATKIMADSYWCGG